jgi:nucleotide-binding universal stress UspA family protein
MLILGNGRRPADSRTMVGARKRVSRMWSRILVGLDGSERAARALAVAAKIARASQGTLILAQVLSAPAEFLPYVSLGLEPSTLSADLESASAYLSTLTTLPEMQGVPAEIEVHTGQAPAKLLELARTRQADLIVLTSHGHTGLAHWALGRVTQKVARHAAVPVLVLRTSGTSAPAGATPVAPAPNTPARALVALDGSPAAEEALGPAVELTVALTAPRPTALWLVRVVPPEVEAEPARAYLRGIVDRLRAAQPPELQLDLSASVVVASDVAHALAEAAEAGMAPTEPASTTATGPCDLMSFTTYGASGPQAWSLGGVAERLLQSAKVPLLIVRPAAQ